MGLIFTFLAGEDEVEEEEEEERGGLWGDEAVEALFFLCGDDKLVVEV